MLDSNFPLRQTEGFVGGFLIRFGILLVALPTVAVFAQQAPQSSSSSPPPEVQTQAENTLTSLAGQFFHGDFVNVFAAGGGIYTVNPAILNSQGTEGSFGFNVAGGVQAFHRFRTSVLSLSYSLGYTNYQGTGYEDGTNQNLSLLYSKQLGRRWTLGFVESAGIFQYGVGYYPQPNAATPAIANPFSSTTKFLSSGVSLTYRQTARLSYRFGGDFFLTRYNYPGAIGTTGGSGSASVIYRLTEHTTVGGTYSHSNFQYQHDAGQAQIDGGYFNASHEFARLWTVSGSVGVSRADSNGFIRVPVSIILNGQQVTGIAVGPYHRTTVTPSFQGSISRRLRQVLITGTAGQVVSPGNGVYLASNNRFFAASASYSMRRSNISASGGYFHLTSLANAISQSYATTSFGASYGYTLARHLGAVVRYDYYKYGNLYNYGAAGDNRISFGVSFTSGSIPLTLY
jgi:hypothetical protein